MDDRILCINIYLYLFTFIMAVENIFFEQFYIEKLNLIHIIIHFTICLNKPILKEICPIFKYIVKMEQFL